MDAVGGEPEETRAGKVFEVFLKMYADDVDLLTVVFLCRREVASLREIARHVGMSHKNLATHLDRLVSKGIVELTYEKPNLKLYRLAAKASVIKPLLVNLNPQTGSP